MSLAGCPGDFPKHRELMFDEVMPINDTDGQYRFRITPIKTSSGESEEWQRFHNVTLVGYSASDTLVCEANIGTTGANLPLTLEPVVVECENPPVIFTYRADESPCDEATWIRYAVHRILEGGERSWFLDGLRECGEGLPPDDARVQNLEHRL